MLCLQLGTVVIAWAVTFASGMLAHSLMRWWLNRDRANKS